MLESPASQGAVVAGGTKAPAAISCAEVTVVSGNASWASCSHDCPAARTPGAIAQLTTTKASIENLRIPNTPLTFATAPPAGLAVPNGGGAPCGRPAHSSRKAFRCQLCFWRGGEC